jgi:hypothetical protein
VTCTGKAGRGGLGSVLAGFGLGVGALWAGVGEITPVGIVQRAEGKRGGPDGFLSVFHVSWPGSGQGRLGLDQGGVHGMATGLGCTISASSTVALILLDFAHQVFDTMPARIQISNF